MKKREAFPCGQCLPCRINRRRVWTHRIMLEAMNHAENSFVTLTYREVPGDRSVCVGELQRWLKRFRKAVYPRAVRYFGVGEYGDETWRPHYHIALFGYGPCRGGVRVEGVCQCFQCSVVAETWGLGHSMVGNLERRSAQYIAGYCVKKMGSADDIRLVERGLKPEFARMSLRPGIGAVAVWDVASECLRYGLAERFGDVPAALRHGSMVLPLGRYLKVLLRERCGLPGTGYAVREDPAMSVLWSYIDSVCKRGVDKNGIVRGVLAGLNEQSERNARCRLNLKRRI